MRICISLRMLRGSPRIPRIANPTPRIPRIADPTHIHKKLHGSHTTFAGVKTEHLSKIHFGIFDGSAEHFRQQQCLVGNLRKPRGRFKLNGQKRLIERGKTVFSGDFHKDHPDVGLGDR
ncbi:hypothetical protein Bbelb_380040 [Branchiostoma belcheri]|nr:hypothetical protein Bbelb_380040 [Branchiostoma belcheri]